MLFGTKEQQRDILEQAQMYADSHDMKLVFGAMVGSVSKGLQYADSDYDTRFLFLRKDFPNKICIPSQMQEEELVKRYYLSDKVYEWIPFWEMTSFLQFLHEPSFKDDFSVGLYNIVGWTFKSPYIWDPYGLQNKLVPLIDSIFKPEFEIAYHQKLVNKYMEEFCEDSVIAKSYLYAVHAAATIEWSMVYGTNPPVDLQTLLLGLNRKEIWKKINEILEVARDTVRKNVSRGNTTLHEAHFTVKASRNELLEKYVEQINSLQFQCEKVDDKLCVETINRMYDIIYHSVFENEELVFEK